MQFYTRYTGVYKNRYCEWKFDVVYEKPYMHVTMESAFVGTYVTSHISMVTPTSVTHVSFMLH